MEFLFFTLILMDPGHSMGYDLGGDLGYSRQRSPESTQGSFVKANPHIHLELGIKAKAGGERKADWAESGGR